MAYIYDPSFVTGAKTFIPSGKDQYRNDATTLNSPTDVISVRPGKTTKTGMLQAAVIRTQHFVNADGLKIGAIEVEKIYRLTGKVPSSALELKVLDVELGDFTTEIAINRLMLGDS